MVACHKKKEMKLWLSSELDKVEFLLLLMFGVEVLMFSKFLLLFAMTFLKIENFIFIELEDLGVSEERELQLTSLPMMMSES